MSDIDDRTAEREAALLETLSGSRRLAVPADYIFDKSQEMFWDLRDGTLHSEKAVDASIPLESWRVEVTEGEPPAEDAPRGRGRPRGRRERLIAPSKDILRVENDQFVEGSTWWPGRPQIIRDWFIDRDGFYPAAGRRIYNQYKAPPEIEGDAGEAWMWVEHIKKLWPDQKEHQFFFNYCAHMIQRPEEKCNAAIVLSGTQGIGKDAALWPIKAAVGSWNCKGVDPDELFSPYKPWLQTLMLTIDEVRPSKDDFHASSMYNILKPMIVAPPDTLPLNDKYQKLRYVINVLRVFITTNDWMAMFIPPEDRRMFIMHSSLPQRWHETEGDPRYFERLFEWFEAGGSKAVGAWLAARDLSTFNPKAQVERTAGWEAVATSWGEPDDAIMQALDILEKPPIVFGSELLGVSFDGAEEVAAMLKSPRKISHRMQRAGYVAIKNPVGERWKFTNGEQKIRSRYAFVKAEMAGGAEQVSLLKAIRERGMSLISGTLSEPEQEGF
jgi:hypothetical protein